MLLVLALTCGFKFINEALEIMHKPGKTRNSRTTETAQAMEQASSAVAELAQQSQALQRLLVEMKKG